MSKTPHLRKYPKVNSTEDGGRRLGEGKAYTPVDVRLQTERTNVAPHTQTQEQKETEREQELAAEPGHGHPLCIS
ncbi:hypothetical protein C0J52_07783 [Blattella germanica]|nr:hypothetical protein C0J52_07783 [Blattella germanica]